MYKFIDDKKQHLHTLDGEPLLGNTTVCGIIAKVLTWWASGMAVSKFGWLDPKKNSPETVQKALEEGFERIKGIDLVGYKKLLGEAYKAHSERLADTAETGTDLHKELENFVKITMLCQESGMVDKTEYPKEIQSFIEWSKKNVKKFLWSELHGYSRDMWTGMIADVGWVDMQDRIIAGDFKSSPKSYFNHFIQVAGCDLMLSENGGFDKDGKQIFTLEKPIQGYAIVPFGKKEIEPEYLYDIDSYRDGYKFALGLYKLNQNFKTTT